MVFIVINRKYNLVKTCGSSNATCGKYYNKLLPLNIRRGIQVGKESKESKESSGQQRHLK